MLFFGSLDLAGVPGLTVSEEGRLLLQSSYLQDLLPATFTCLVFNQNTWEDVPVHRYAVTLVPGNWDVPDAPIPPTPAW